MTDAAATIDRLRAELGATPRETNPYEHALLAHRLGLANAEAVTGTPDERLRQALAYFDLAATLLDARFHPVERARVLTAAGAARRGLGETAAALDLFRRASALATARVRPDEAAAMANNVGLALLELGDVPGAVERFDEAAGLFDVASAEGRRGLASALHNRGLARATGASQSDLAAAIGDYDEAMAAVSFDDAAMHHGLVRQSRGVAAAALVELDPESAAQWRRTALDAFTAALEVFAWPDHAVHHGIVSFNLGRMWAIGDADDDLRRAVLGYEDAITAFDPRHQAGPWRQAYEAMTAVEQRLATGYPGWTRTDHLLALLDADGDGAPRLMRGRLARWLPLPAAARDAALGGYVRAAIRQGGDVGVGALTLLLSTVIELPVEAQSVVLDALIAVRAAADDDDREAVDRLVDRAVGEAVVGPQRVFVRDHLVAGGFERP
ncbi:MAG: hypothetical protein M3Q72_02810 [Actinomycetota bacterium]|nr:hypothetical protein [Actinomycetota bacterium]